MNITNNFGLPQPFVDAVTYSEYDKGDTEFSATELIKPVRILALQRRHAGEITEDASDRVWALSGSAKHSILERIAKQNPERYIVERRFSTFIEGRKISGQLDLYDRDEKVLYDWKEITVAKYQIGDFHEWEQQANINLHCLRMNYIYPESIVNIAFLRDWKKSESYRRADYPKCAIHIVPLTAWTPGEAAAFIQKRIAKLDAEMENPPVCTPEERWQNEPTFAVKNGTNKKALRVLDSKSEAEIWMAEKGKGTHIEERPAAAKRCQMYCNVRPFCPEGQALAEAE